MKYLESVLAVIARQGSVVDKAMHERWKEVGEFKKYLWERGNEMGRSMAHYPPQTVQDRGWGDDAVLRYGSDCG
jgi:hypothetical protein